MSIAAVGRLVTLARVLAIALAAFAHGSHAPSPVQAAEKLTVGVTAIGAADGGLLMAKETGLFREHGLDVDWVFFASGIEGVQALSSAVTCQ